MKFGRELNALADRRGCPGFDQTPVDAHADDAGIGRMRTFQHQMPTECAPLFVHAARKKRRLSDEAAKSVAVESGNKTRVQALSTDRCSMYVLFYEISC